MYKVTKEAQDVTIVTLQDGTIVPIERDPTYRLQQIVDVETGDNIYFIGTIEVSPEEFKRKEPSSKIRVIRVEERDSQKRLI